MLGFLLLLGILCVVYVLGSRMFTSYALDHLSYTCHYDKTRVEEGDAFHLTEELCNHSALPLPWVRAELTLSSAIEFAGTHSHVTDHTRYVQSMFAPKSYANTQREWNAVAHKRGVYPIEKVLLVTGDLLDSMHVSRAVEESDRGQAILVTPCPFRACGELLSYLPRSMGEYPERFSLYTDPFAPSGSREYSGRESLHSMDWKATARTQVLHTRVFDRTVDRFLSIHMITQITRYGGEWISESLREHTLRVAVRLVEECTQQRIPCRLTIELCERGVIFTSGTMTTQRDYEAMLAELAFLSWEETSCMAHIPPLDRAPLVVTSNLSKRVREYRDRFPSMPIYLTTHAEHVASNIISVPEYEKGGSR